MHRSKSSILSLVLRTITTTPPLIGSNNKLYSTSKHTHFISSPKFGYISSGSCDQTPFCHFHRLHLSMASQSSEPKSIYDFTVKDVQGNEVNLSKYKGKVLLIVNVASQCGLTNSNYPELTQLYEKYKDKGLEILAFPCNQFGNQEPGNNKEIKEFACTRFKAEFPIFDKIEVNGSNAAPVYKYLKSRWSFRGWYQMEFHKFCC